MSGGEDVTQEITALRAELTTMTQDRDSLKIIASRALDGEAALREQLAASQAREEQLRELLGGTRKSPRIAS